MRPAMTAAIETTPPPAPAPRRTDVTPRHILSRRPPIVRNNAPIRPEIAHFVQKKTANDSLRPQNDNLRFLSRKSAPTSCHEAKKVFSNTRPFKEKIDLSIPYRYPSHPPINAPTRPLPAHFCDTSGPIPAQHNATAAAQPHAVTGNRLPTTGHCRSVQRGKPKSRYE